MAKKLKKMVTMKQRFEESRKAIIERVLCQTPPKEREIDIEQHYNRSAATLGQYATLDWKHRGDIRSLKNDISSYSSDSTKKRPLNFIMVAQPGSGKSHFIKCLATAMDSYGVSAITFNMATLKSTDDFVQPLDAVRNLKVADRIPILFLDEFDSDPANYSLLLPLLWDGEIHLGHRHLKLGKVVIMLAGSDLGIKTVMDSAKNMLPGSDEIKGESRDKKLIDLLSRVNGGIFEVPDLDIVNASRNRRVDKVCIAISLLQNRFGDALKLIPWRLLHFVGLNKFRYGVRSIAHLIDFISLNEKNPTHASTEELSDILAEEESLKNCSLAYHLVHDSGSGGLVAMWNDYAQNNTYVRIRPELEDEEIE